MNNFDEPTFDAGANGASQAPLTEPNGNGESPVAGQAQTPPPQEYLSRADFERMRAEDDAKWQARLTDVERKAQAKADKARDTAIRKTDEFVKTTLPALKKAGVELDENQILQTTNVIREEQFWTADPPETQAQTAPNYAPQPNLYVNEQEILAALASEGLKPTDIDYKGFLGKEKGDELGKEWAKRVILAKAAQIQAEEQAKANRLAAAPIAQVARTTGGLGSPQGGAPSAGVDPKAELAQLMTQEPPNDPISLAKYQQRIQELYAKVDGKW